MRKITLKNAKPGMVLARPVYNLDGNVLLSKGVTLNETFLSKLKEMAQPSIFIQEEAIGSFNVHDVLSEDTRFIAAKTVRNIFQDIHLKDHIDGFLAKKTVDHIMAEVIHNRNALANLVEVRSFDSYVFSHSVNVCALSLLIGIFMGYNQVQLRDLGVGALLHDIGKMKVDREILNKIPPLTADEFNQIKKHSACGFEILKGYPEISLLSSHVALQHHERMDGSGYPRGLAGEEIHEYARIVAVADVFDALLADRPNRQGYLPHEACQIMNNPSAEKLFEQKILHILLENVALYPQGSFIQLSNGIVGMVVDINKGFPARPVVRILFGQDGKKVGTLKEVDLSREMELCVQRVFKEEQINLILNF